jgi:hypothetical protein
MLHRPAYPWRFRGNISQSIPSCWQLAQGGPAVATLHRTFRALQRRHATADLRMRALGSSSSMLTMSCLVRCRGLGLITVVGQRKDVKIQQQHE